MADNKAWKAHTAPEILWRMAERAEELGAEASAREFGRTAEEIDELRRLRLAALDAGEIGLRGAAAKHKLSEPALTRIRRRWESIGAVGPAQHGASAAAKEAAAGTTSTRRPAAAAPRSTITGNVGDIAEVLGLSGEERDEFGEIFSKGWEQRVAPEREVVGAALRAAWGLGRTPEDKARNLLRVLGMAATGMRPETLRNLQLAVSFEEAQSRGARGGLVWDPEGRLLPVVKIPETKGQAGPIPLIPRGALHQALRIYLMSGAHKLWPQAADPFLADAEQPQLAEARRLARQSEAHLLWNNDATGPLDKAQERRWWQGDRADRPGILSRAVSAILGRQEKIWPGRMRHYFIRTIALEGQQAGLPRADAFARAALTTLHGTAATSPEERETKALGVVARYARGNRAEAANLALEGQRWVPAAVEDLDAVVSEADALEDRIAPVRATVGAKQAYTAGGIDRAALEGASRQALTERESVLVENPILADYRAEMREIIRDQFAEGRRAALRGQAPSFADEWVKLAQTLHGIYEPRGIPGEQIDKAIAAEWGGRESFLDPKTPVAKKLPATRVPASVAARLAEISPAPVAPAMGAPSAVRDALVEPIVARLMELVDESQRQPRLFVAARQQEFDRLLRQLREADPGLAGELEARLNLPERGLGTPAAVAGAEEARRTRLAASAPEARAAAATQAAAAAEAERSRRRIAGLVREVEGRLERGVRYGDAPGIRRALAQIAAVDPAEAARVTALAFPEPVAAAAQAAATMPPEARQWFAQGAFGTDLPFERPIEATGAFLAPPEGARPAAGAGGRPPAAPPTEPEPGTPGHPLLPVDEGRLGALGRLGQAAGMTGVATTPLVGARGAEGGPELYRRRLKDLRKAFSSDEIAAEIAAAEQLRINTRAQAYRSIVAGLVRGEEEWKALPSRFKRIASRSGIKDVDELRVRLSTAEGRKAVDEIVNEASTTRLVKGGEKAGMIRTQAVRGARGLGTIGMAVGAAVSLAHVAANWNEATRIGEQLEAAGDPRGKAKAYTDLLSDFIGDDLMVYNARTGRMNYHLEEALPAIGGVVGGALGGGALGFFAGGPIGALIGLGVGTVAGLMGERVISAGRREEQRTQVAKKEQEAAFPSAKERAALSRWLSQLAEPGAAALEDRSRAISAQLQGVHPAVAGFVGQEASGRIQRAGEQLAQTYYAPGRPSPVTERLAQAWAQAGWPGGKPPEMATQPYRGGGVGEVMADIFRTAPYFQALPAYGGEAPAGGPYAHFTWPEPPRVGISQLPAAGGGLDLQAILEQIEASGMLQP